MPEPNLLEPIHATNLLNVHRTRSPTVSAAPAEQSEFLDTTRVDRSGGKAIVALTNEVGLGTPAPAFGQVEESTSAKAAGHPEESSLTPARPTEMQSSPPSSNIDAANNSVTRAVMSQEPVPPGTFLNFLV